MARRRAARLSKQAPVSPTTPALATSSTSSTTSFMRRPFSLIGPIGGGGGSGGGGEGKRSSVMGIMGAFIGGGSGGASAQRDEVSLQPASDTPISARYHRASSRRCDHHGPLADRPATTGFAHSPAYGREPIRPTTSRSVPHTAHGFPHISAVPLPLCGSATVPLAPTRPPRPSARLPRV